MLWYKVAWLSRCKTQAAAAERVVWERESGVHVFIIPEKLLHSQRENKRQVGQLHCVSPSSPSQPSPVLLTSVFSLQILLLVHFALILAFLFLLLCCLFPVISVFILPFSSFFFLNLPSADSFCLCDLPHFIHPVCSYRNRVLAARLCVRACIRSCSHFLSSSNFWTTFKQYLKEGQRSKVLWK